MFVGSAEVCSNSTNPRFCYCARRPSSAPHHRPAEADLARLRLIWPGWGWSGPAEADLVRLRLIRPGWGWSGPAEAVLARRRLFWPGGGCSGPAEADLARRRLFWPGGGWSGPAEADLARRRLIWPGGGCSDCAPCPTDLGGGSRGSERSRTSLKVPSRTLPPGVTRSPPVIFVIGERFKFKAVTAVGRSGNVGNEGVGGHLFRSPEFHGRSRGVDARALA